MKRALVFALLLAACADVDQPRAYRCESTPDCVSPWVCLKDHYCHDPSIGVATACEVSSDCAGGWACARDKVCHNPDAGISVECEATSDCLGGWFCGKDLRCHNPTVAAALTCDTAAQCGGGWFCANDGTCHDPTVAAALPCAGDENCAGGWRCDTEGTCVEPPRAVSTAAVVSGVTQRSPLGPGATRLQASPSWAEDDGGTVVLQAAFASSGFGYVETMRVTPGDLTTEVSVQRDVVPFTGVTNIAATQGWFLAAVDGGTWLGDLGGATSTLLPVTAREMRPMLQPLNDGGVTPYFALTIDGGVALVSVDGGLGISTDAGLVDYTFSLSSPYYAIALATSVSSLGGARFTDAGTVLHTWVENDHVGATVRRSNGVVSAIYFPRDGLFSSPASCPEGDVLDVSISSTQYSGPMEYVCRGSTGTYVWQVRQNQTPMLLHDYAASIVSGVSGGHTRQLSTGVLRLGSDLLTDLPDVLDGRPAAIGALFDSQALAAVRGSSLFLDNHVSAPMGLGLAVIATPGSPRPVGFVGGTTAAIYSSGLVIDFATPQTGDETIPWIFEGTPSLTAPIAEAVSSSAGLVLIASDGDTLWAGLRDDVARAVLKPTPGFAISSWVARAAAGSAFEGWAVANNRLFQLSATDVGHWKLQELPLTGNDPFGVVYLDGEAYVATTSGALIALPSRVQLAPGLDEPLTSLAGVCKTLIATTSTQAFQLINATWEPLSGASWLRSPRVHRSGDRLFLSSDDGVVLQVDGVCAP